MRPVRGQRIVGNLESARLKGDGGASGSVERIPARRLAGKAVVMQFVGEVRREELGLVVAARLENLEVAHQTLKNAGVVEFFLVLQVGVDIGPLFPLRVASCISARRHGAGGHAHSARVLCRMHRTHSPAPPASPRWPAQQHLRTPPAPPVSPHPPTHAHRHRRRPMAAPPVCSTRSSLSRRAARKKQARTSRRAPRQTACPASPLASADRVRPRGRPQRQRPGRPRRHLHRRHPGGRGGWTRPRSRPHARRRPRRPGYILPRPARRFAQQATRHCRPLPRTLPASPSLPALPSQIFFAGSGKPEAPPQCRT